MQKQVIIYGAGLIANELCRFLEWQDAGTARVCCFAVTNLEGMPRHMAGHPVMDIRDALGRYPEAEVYIAVQEKYHGAVRQTLHELAREPREAFGLRRMAAIWKAAGICQIHRELLGWRVGEDPDDCTMLALAPRGFPDRVFKLYPMTQVPLKEEDIAYLRDLGQNGGCLGQYGRQQGSRDSAGKACRLFIGMACWEEDTPLREMPRLPAFVHSVHSGAALSKRKIGEFRDDAGENISALNLGYAELDVAYWMWKNVADYDYLGLCHYRRHFILSDTVLRRIRQGDVDVILTRPRVTFPSVKGFLVDSLAASLEREEYGLMLHALARRGMGEEKRVEAILRGRILYPNNMVIARREIFRGYSRWMFGILEECRRAHEASGRPTRSRYLGFLGEMLTSAYFMLHAGEYRVECVDYRLYD